MYDKTLTRSAKYTVKQELNSLTIAQYCNGKGVRIIIIINLIQPQH